LEKGEKRVPLQPANEETKLAGKFIKELEKAKRERKKILRNLLRNRQNIHTFAAASKRKRKFLKRFESG
jgi:hypothetical protein